MSTVGSVLKEERLKQGLTQESVSVETKLPLRSLSAIESDDLSVFGSPFFYKSFVKQYASWIRVDYGQIAPLVEARIGEMPSLPLPGERDQHPDLPAINPSYGNYKNKWVFPAAALVAVLLGCSGIYAWWEGKHGPHTPKMPASTVSAQASLPIPAAVIPADTATTSAPGDDPGTQSPAVQLSTSQVDTPVETPQSEPAATDEGGPSASVGEVQLKISALERVWVSVVSDGNSIFNGILEMNETKAFESHETTKIKIGNAGCLQVEYNGQTVGALGGRGQVLTAVFTPQNYEILNSRSDQQPAPRQRLRHGRFHSKDLALTKVPPSGHRRLASMYPQTHSYNATVVPGKANGSSPLANQHRQRLGRRLLHSSATTMSRLLHKRHSATLDPDRPQAPGDQ